MDFDLKELLNTAGPTATLILAAGFFLQFITQRYLATYDRYRALIAEFRGHNEKNKRHETLLEQIELYRTRCNLMRWATTLALTATSLFVLTLASATCFFAFELGFLKWVTLILSLSGLVVMLTGVGITMNENVQLRKVMTAEESDIPQLAAVEK